MLNRFDKSKKLANYIRSLSDWIAKRHGIIPLTGIILVIIGFVFLLIDVFVQVRIIEFFGVLFQGIGLITALTGILLAEPLGK